MCFLLFWSPYMNPTVPNYILPSLDSLPSKEGQREKAALLINNKARNHTYRGFFYAPFW